jgi:hypothetical protein
MKICSYLQNLLQINWKKRTKMKLRREKPKMRTRVIKKQRRKNLD